MVGAGRHNKFLGGAAESVEKITFIMQNTKQANPRRQNGLFRGALNASFVTS
jgi:hypothetical protein